MASVARDDVEPLHRPAREVARRQIVDRNLGRQRRQGEADQAHVVIERQPARRPVALDDVEPGGSDHSGEVGHQRGLGDLHAMRMAGAAGRELDIAELVRPERPQVDRLLRQGFDHVHAAMEPDRRKFGGGIGQEFRQIVETDRGDRAGRRELAAKLVEVGVLAADPDRNGNRHRQQAGILGAEKGIEEAGPGIGGDQQPLATRKSRPDQLARHDMGTVAHLFPGQGGERLATRTIESDTGLPLRRIVQHLRHRLEVGTAQGKLTVAGGIRAHDLFLRGKAGLLAEGSGALRHPSGPVRQS